MPCIMLTYTCSSSTIFSGDCRYSLHFCQIFLALLMPQRRTIIKLNIFFSTLIPGQHIHISIESNYLRWLRIFPDFQIIHGSIKITMFKRLLHWMLSHKTFNFYWIILLFVICIFTYIPYVIIFIYYIHNLVTVIYIIYIYILYYILYTYYIYIYSIRYIY